MVKKRWRGMEERDGGKGWSVCMVVLVVVGSGGV